jgi:phosphatidylglycerol:prolipoprotein diacylglycerol transferase
MYPELLSLYGPFSIQTYGVFIAIGLVIFTFAVLYDYRRKGIIEADQFFNVLTVGFLAALIGGRILYFLTNWQSHESCWDFFAVWLGGFSLLGSTVAIILTVPAYLYAKKIPLLSFLDLVTTYTPLLQSISRLGCFFAGCCYGAPTSFILGIIPRYPIAQELNGIALHPTQLYSSFFLFIIFIILFIFSKRSFLKPGQLMCLYLFFMSIERFTVDFWRGDREFVFGYPFNFLSVAQYIALLLAALGLIGLFYFACKKKS